MPLEGIDVKFRAIRSNFELQQPRPQFVVSLARNQLLGGPAETSVEKRLNCGGNRAPAFDDLDNIFYRRPRLLHHSLERMTTAPSYGSRQYFASGYALHHLLIFLH